MTKRMNDQLAKHRDDGRSCFCQTQEIQLDMPFLLVNSTTVLIPVWEAGLSAFWAPCLSV
eukprot:scaffold206200_cov33-Prasinocladus_malaysianus.AAC.2